MQNNTLNNSVFSAATKEKAMKFIQNEEGFKSIAYQDIAGVWTIGFGTVKNVKKGDKITREEAEKLFERDFYSHIKPLEFVKIPLSENEKIALASLIYNIGAAAFKGSTLLKKLNQGDKQGAAKEFEKWIYANGKISKGLKNRREREKKLFLSA